MPGVLDEMTDEYLERLKRKRIGLYRGIVRDIDDPEQKGRVRVEIHELLGEGKLTDWVSYCAPFGGGGAGFYMLPELGDGVWIMFERGEPSKPVWIGFWYSEEDAPPEDGGKNVRVIQTKSGHKIVFNDKEGSESIEITDPAGNHVRIDTKSGEIILNVNMMLRLGSSGAAESVVLGDSYMAFCNTFVSLVNALVAAFSSHTHIGNLALPTTPPSVPFTQVQQPMTPALLSQKVKTE
jgi:phage baseplate assembly protein gpV